MEHPVPQGTLVDVMCQNNTIITAEVVEYHLNDVDGLYHYRLQSNGWGDGNISESVILKAVSQVIVILKDE